MEVYGIALYEKKQLKYRTAANTFQYELSSSICHLFSQVTSQTKWTLVESDVFGHGTDCLVWVRPWKTKIKGNNQIQAGTKNKETLHLFYIDAVWLLKVHYIYLCYIIVQLY